MNFTTTLHQLQYGTSIDYRGFNPSDFELNEFADVHVKTLSDGTVHVRFVGGGTIAVLDQIVDATAIAELERLAEIS